jgi:type IV secretory pathway VirB6-like protein
MEKIENTNNKRSKKWSYLVALSPLSISLLITIFYILLSTSFVFTTAIGMYILSAMTIYIFLGLILLICDYNNEKE